MSSNYLFKDSLPLAPLKLAALEGCKDLASLVNDHIVHFRRHDMEELKRRKADLNYRGYDVSDKYRNQNYQCRKQYFPFILSQHGHPLL